MTHTKNPSRKAPKPISSEEFDAKFERGEDITEYLDLSKARVVPAMLKPKKVNVDFPSWVVSGLDRESNRLGIPRQSLIKFWIAERLESEAAKH